jgi:hypothetical protein
MNSIEKRRELHSITNPSGIIKQFFQFIILHSVSRMLQFVYMLMSCFFFFNGSFEGLSDLWSFFLFDRHNVLTDKWWTKLKITASSQGSANYKTVSINVISLKALPTPNESHTSQPHASSINKHSASTAKTKIVSGFFLLQMQISVQLQKCNNSINFYWEAPVMQFFGIAIRNEAAA